MGRLIQCKPAFAPFRRVSRPWAMLAMCAALSAPLTLGGCNASVTHARGNEPAERAVQVPSITVSEQPMPHYLALTGTLAANQQSQVAADATGRVRSTFVERGSVVQQGDVLVQLDARSARLSQNEAVAQAEGLRSQRDAAKRDCERAERLLRDQAIGQAEYDRTSAQCSAAQWSSEAALARAELADKNLGEAAVRAPFAGIVVERQVGVGEYVRPGTQIVSLVQVDPLRLQLTVPEHEIGHVREGQIVRFEVAAFPGRAFEGRVARVSPSIREGTRDRVVEAIVDNQQRELLPGMFALGRIEVGKDKKPVVPASAIRGEGNKSRVFAIVDGRLEERLVQIGERDGEVVALEHGAASGERVAKNASGELRDGLRVE